LEELLESIALRAFDKKTRRLAADSPLGNIFDRALETILAKARARGFEWLKQNDEPNYHLAMAAMDAWEARYTPQPEVRDSLLRSGFANFERSRRSMERHRGRVAGAASASTRDQGATARRDFAIEADRQIGEMRARTGKSKTNCAGLVRKAMKRKRGPFTIPDDKYKDGRALLELIRREFKRHPW
jgi:hypothetical protein